MSEQRGELPTLLVFADDWGRHPSSCQHLIRQLLGRYEVHWINTIGMRPPRLDWATVHRAGGKLRGWLRPSAETPATAPEHLHVASPRMWPWFRTRFDRRLNRWLLGRQLRRLIQRLPTAPTVITTIPIVADLMGVLPVRRWIYYCVDDFGQWPGLDQGPLQEMEQTLVRQADCVLAVSENLQERLTGMGRTPYLFPHGVDLDHWADLESQPALPELTGLERPLIVFWGLIDPRMDPAMIERLGADLERGTIVLVGPEQNADPRLLKAPRVVRLVPLPYSRLPALAKDTAVLIMPYADLPVTRAIQPLKLKEYLATGKPTVVRNLPAVEAWADALDAVATPEEFSRIVRLRLRTGLPEEQRQARKRLSAEGWQAKARELEQIALAEASASVGAIA